MATASLSPSIRFAANAAPKRRLTKLLRRFTAAADLCFYRFLAALHESRRRQAARFIAESRNPTLTVVPPTSRRRPPAKRG